MKILSLPVSAATTEQIFERMEIRSTGILSRIILSSQSMSIAPITTLAAAISLGVSVSGLSVPLPIFIHVHRSSSIYAMHAIEEKNNKQEDRIVN
jgi:hypothetical protein